MFTTRIRRLQNLDYGLLLALLLPLWAVIPLLTHAGLPNTADGPVHLMRQVELNQAWQQGNFYPRWGTDLALGHGMPIFSYAPPLLYQASQLFHLTGLPLAEAMKATVIAAFLLYSAGMFLFVRRIFGPYPALVAAAGYVYAPYRLREAYIQGNYGQFLGLAFYPLIFWAFHGLITDGRPRYLAAAALSLAGLLFSHNISFMLFAPIFGAYVIFLLALRVVNGEGRRAKGLGLFQLVDRSILQALGRAVVAGLLGLGLAAIFWLPAFGERHEIKLEGITQGFFDFRENFISVAEFFSPPKPLDLAAINPEFPLSLGLPQIIGASLGLIGLIFLIFRRLIPKHHSPTLPIFHSLFFAIFLALYAYLALPPSRPLWEAIPLLELAEFPWRMLGPALFCASFLTAAALATITGCYTSGVTHHVSRSRSRPYILLSFPAIFITITFNIYYLYPSQFIPWGTPTPAEAFAYEATTGAIGTTSTGEFLPRWARQHPQAETLWPDYEAGRPPERIDPATAPEGATVETLDHLAESEILQINTPQPFEATLRLLYWPGWQLYLNEQPWPFTPVEGAGLIQTMIPAGQHTLRLQLETTPLRSCGKWLSLISAGVLAILTGWSAWRYRSGGFRDQPPDRVDLESGAGIRNSPPAVSGLVLAGAALLLAAGYLLSRPLEPFFTLRSDPDRPQPAAQLLRADFGDQLRLVGTGQLPQTINRDLEVVLYWRALQKLETNYSVFVHLDAPNGQTYATVDEKNPENIPTRNWPPGLYLRNPLHLNLPANLPPIRYELNVGVYRRETGRRLPLAGTQRDVFSLGPVWITGPQPRLAGLVARFGDPLILRQAALKEEVLTLYWETNQPLAPEATLFIHLLDAQGNLIGQLDGPPYEGLYPLAHWLPGQLIVDARPLNPYLEDKRRLNTVAVGVYNMTNGERWPAVDAAGQPLPHNSFLLPVQP